MTAKERREHRRLQRLWATRRANMKQMLRCIELTGKANAEAREAERLADQKHVAMLLDGAEDDAEVDSISAFYAK